MPIFRRASSLIQIAVLLAWTAAPAHAAIFTVGTDAGCTQATIQLAINAAEASAGGDTIRITRSLSYTAQQLVVTTSQDLNMVGGFATCVQAAADTIKTTISGAGGATEPVMRINGNTGSTIKLRQLLITGGDEDGAGNGGGIYFRGNGVLELIESAVSNNSAGYGGGIYAEGTGTAAELIISNDVTISSNVARGSGGGIYVDSLEMTMIAPGSLLALNTAQGNISGGYGGGLLVNSIDFGAYATIGSTGQGGLGAVYGNWAQRGGGIAVVASNDEERPSELQLGDYNLAQPTALINNAASIAGGGLYVLPTKEILGRAEAEANVTNALIYDNEAPEGAAIYLDKDFDGVAIDLGGRLFLSGGRIAGNRTVDVNAQATTGSVVHASSASLLSLYRVAIENNIGGRLVRSSNTGPAASSVGIDNSMLAGNQASLDLLSVEGGDNSLSVSDSTLAGNSIGGANIVFTSSDVQIERSILWQPGKTVLQQVSGELIVVDVIGNEVTSLGGGPQAIVGPPRFIDPARGDFGLRASSAAVDFAPAISGDDRDLLGLPRDQDLPIKANFRGPRDIGALERQSLLPLVLNQDFNVDLNLWPIYTANSATRDAAENASGAAGSGSVKVDLETELGFPGNRLTALSQCIHLPGPALYALNGWGRSSAGGSSVDRDASVLYWEFRRNGGEACTDGAPDASGDHRLTNSTNWVRPTIPAYINVAPGDWTDTSSITIYQVVIDNGMQLPRRFFGRFDGITLEPDTDIIFRDGFE